MLRVAGHTGHSGQPGHRNAGHRTLPVDRDHRIHPGVRRRPGLPEGVHPDGHQHRRTADPHQGHADQAGRGGVLLPVGHEVPQGVHRETGTPAAEDPADPLHAGEISPQQGDTDRVTDQSGAQRVQQRAGDEADQPHLQHTLHIRDRVGRGEGDRVERILEGLETHADQHTGDESVPGSVPPGASGEQQQHHAEGLGGLLGPGTGQRPGDLRRTPPDGELRQVFRGGESAEHHTAGHTPQDGGEGEQDRSPAVEQGAGDDEPDHGGEDHAQTEGEDRRSRPGEEHPAEHREPGDQGTQDRHHQQGDGEDVPEELQTRTRGRWVGVVPGAGHGHDLPVRTCLRCSHRILPSRSGSAVDTSCGEAPLITRVYITSFGPVKATACA